MQLWNQNMQMSSQTTVGNYQTIGLLFLSFPLFGKAVKKILEENSKLPVGNIIFLKKFNKKNLHIDFTIKLSSLSKLVRAQIRRPEAHCKPKVKSGPVILFCAGR